MKIKFVIMLILAVLSLIAISKSTVFLETHSCVGCGDCLEVCPVDAISLIDGKAVIDADTCIECYICIGSCTYDAIRRSR